MHIPPTLLLAIISLLTLTTANTHIRQDPHRERALRFGMTAEMEKRQLLSAVGGLLGGDASTSSTIARVTTSAVPITTPAKVTTPAQVTTSAAADVTSSSVVSKVTSSLVVSSTVTSSSATATGTSMSSGVSSSHSTSSVSSSETSSAISSSTPTSSPTSSTSTITTADGTTLVHTIITSVHGGSSNSSNTTSSSHVTSSSGGLSTGAIVGIAVVGGVAALAIGLFVLWKLKRKRFGGDYDDEDAIKWPELNRHGDMSTVHPLPARPTGGHGLETNAMERDGTDLDGEPIHSGMMDNEFEYSYPPQHPNPSLHNHGADYYDRSPTIGGYTDGNAGSYMSHGTGGVSSEHGPFTDAAGAEDSTFGRQGSLGGTRAFEVDGGQDEMRMMGGSGSATGVGRRKSGRLL